MRKSKKPVKAFKHKADKRAHSPSGEEAGCEAGSPKVAAAPDQREFPRNPIVQRGQDPELFWMHKYGADNTETRTGVDIRSLYRHTSHPFPVNRGQKVAVRVISQFGEETTKVLVVAND